MLQQGDLPGPRKYGSIQPATDSVYVEEEHKANCCATKGLQQESEVDLLQHRSQQ